jgi:hypothetical protein
LDYLTTHTSLSPIRRGFAHGFVNYKKGALDSQSQVIDKKFTSYLPMVWFSPVSSTTKTGRHDIAESGIKHQKSNNFFLSVNLCHTSFTVQTVVVLEHLQVKQKCKYYNAHPTHIISNTVHSISNVQNFDPISVFVFCSSCSQTQRP